MNIVEIINTGALEAAIGCRIKQHRFLASWAAGGTIEDCVIASWYCVPTPERVAGVVAVVRHLLDQSAAREVRPDVDWYIARERDFDAVDPRFAESASDRRTGRNVQLDAGDRRGHRLDPGTLRR